MRLVGIWNVFDGLELLKGSIEQIRPHLDGVVVVSQTFSNYGEQDTQVYPFIESLVKEGLVDSHLHYDPDVRPGISPRWNEQAKRQLGIDYAKQEGYTHFVGLDCDEYYDTDEFGDAKAYIEDSGDEASAVRIQTYYKRPTLMLERIEDYMVPFIHKLEDRTVTGVKNYPARVDPTRGISFKGSLVKMHPGTIIMHHYSWVRKDIEKKIRNSTARRNIDTANVRKDYENAAPGYFVSGYGMRLVETHNKFGIDDFCERGKNGRQHP